MRDLTFQLFSIHNTPNYRGGDDTLSLFGRTADGSAVKVDVEGFRPYIFLEMSESEWRTWWPRLKFLATYRSCEKKFAEAESTDDLCYILAGRLRKSIPMPIVIEETGFGIKDVTFGSPTTFIRLVFRNWPQLQKLKSTMRNYQTTVTEILDPSSALMMALMPDGSVPPDDKVRTSIQPFIASLEEAPRDFVFKTFEGCFDCGSMFLIHYNVKPSSWLAVTPVSHAGSGQYHARFGGLSVSEGTGPPMANVRILSYDIEAVPFVVEDGSTLFPQPERDPICTIGIACYEFGTGRMELHALSVGLTSGNWSRADDPSGDDYDPSTVQLHQFKDEEKMLLYFSDFIREYDPDFISGYNILNFDNYYTLRRASYKCSDGRSLMWGRASKPCVPEKRFTSSNQLGGREFWDVKIIGREWFDLYNICKIDHKLRSYKLDDVAAHFLGTRKIEISYDDIPKMCKTPDGRKRLAVYCVKDAFLPLQLCIKLCKLQNSVSLSFVTGAPIDHILNRGQQIRTLNLIVRYVRTHTPRLYIPDRTEENTEGFEGAVVIEPIKGFYKRPVAVLDFASLYPSTMIANNMCFSTKISRADAEKHGLEQGKDFLAIRDFKREGETFEFLDQPHDTCFLMKDKRPGVLPEILASLLAARKAEKKLMKKCDEGSINYGVHNGNQLALKISANSIYGFTGASRGVLTDPQISSAVTRRGRAMTNEAAFVAETAFEGTRCVYGDSVAGRTPLLLKRNGKIMVEKISDLRLGTVPTYTWTERGWTEIKNIICHRLSPEKQMLRIFTHTGMVDCTSDHSLVNSDGHAMFPSSIVCGETALMQSFPTKWSSKDQYVDMTCTRRFIYNGNQYESAAACIQTLGLQCQPSQGVWMWNKKECLVTQDFARLMGFFMGDGSCGQWKTRSTWQLNNANYTMLLYYQSILEKIFQEFEWSIMDTMGSSSVYKLAPSKSQYGSVVHFVDNWRRLLYSGKDKIVPTVILNSPEHVRRAFLQGLHDADGTKGTKLPEISQKSQIAAQSICTLLKSLGYIVVVDGRKDKPNVFRLRCRVKTRKPHNVVKRVIELPHEEFVYDLTTENHHFHAGIGNMIVHNTDSIFVELGESICPMEGKTEAEILQKAQEVGEMMSAHITKCFRAPNDLEYEKTFKPFLLKGKKRYAGRKFEPGKKVCMDIKGFECVRRDFAPFLASSQKIIFDKLVGQEDVDGSVNYAKEIIHRLLSNKMELSELTMCRKLTRAPKDYSSKLIHVQLAIELKRILPETMAPKVGDRIEYVVRKGEGKLYEKGVQPSDILSGKAEIDMSYYMDKQVYQPYKRIFELLDPLTASVTVLACKSATYDEVEKRLAPEFVGCFKDENVVVVEDTEEGRATAELQLQSIREYNAELRKSLNKRKYTVLSLSSVVPEGSITPGKTKIVSNSIVLVPIVLVPQNESGTNEVVVEADYAKLTVLVEGTLRWEYTYVDCVFHEYHKLKRVDTAKKRNEKSVAAAMKRIETSKKKALVRKRKREHDEKMRLKKIGARDIRSFFGIGR